MEKVTDLEKLNFAHIGEQIKEASLIGELLTICRKKRKKMTYATIRTAFKKGGHTPATKLVIKEAVSLCEVKELEIIPIGD